MVKRIVLIEFKKTAYIVYIYIYIIVVEFPVTHR